MSRTLLIDADLLAYRCSAALQQTIDWNGDGSCVSVNGREKEAKRAAELEVEEMMDKLKADDLVICLSDEVENFRKCIDPTYKTNRNGTERPIHLYDIKDHLAEKYPSRVIPTLEADDVMGIMATEPHKGERVMVTLDKDLQTVPGLLCRPPREGKWQVLEITPEKADEFHLWQTLTGDQTDGYPGCPGCGPMQAEKLLQGAAWVGTLHTFTKGKRAGQQEVRWALETDEPAWTRWGAVMSAYIKVGLDREDALKQARLAFILRHGYLEGRRVRLWEPPVYG